ncbi:YcxB family protein [uncultured Selenomonas sp.]|uniref:YcxB family protein n=1 Tax=uncultured Selenomonas sp. TaxID=159275 RepID=UPI002585B9F8|nr:YcxB family protein [uncultured Selenomonas sp.]
MKFTFDLTPQDYIDYTLFYARRAPFFKKQRRRLRLAAAFGPSVVFVFVLLRGRVADLVHGAILAGLMLLLALVIYWVMVKISNAALRRNARAMFLTAGRNNSVGARIIECGDQHLTEHASYYDMTARYKQFIALQRSATAFYLTMGPAEVLIIPLRAFSSDEEQKKFIDLMGQKEIPYES